MNFRLLVFISFLFIFDTLFSQKYFNLDWKREAAILGLSGASFTYGELTNSNIQPLTISQINALSVSDISSFDRSATDHIDGWAADVSNLGVISCMAAPLTLFLDKKIQSEFMTIGVMYAEVLGLGTTLPSLTKNSVHRIRPYVYHPDKDIESKMSLDAQRSFFSGHTCVAFSSAVFLSTVYSTYFPKSKWKPVVWGGSLLAAGTVGFMRYRSGNHFPTDILVGACVGAGIGYLVPRLHRNKTNSLSIAPIMTDQTMSFYLSYQF